MPVHNREIAEHFSKLADLLEIEGANPYRIRAYRNAARTITNLSQSLVSLLEEGRNLAELPDIGGSIAQKIETYVETGTLPQLEAAERRTPGALSELMKVEGLGPKRVQTLHTALKIRSLEDLKRAAHSGRISQLPGFGKKTEATILRRLEQFHGEEARLPLQQAEELAQPLVAYLRATEGVKDITVAGSYRRRKETVGDLDVLVTARKGSPVMERFTHYDEVVEVISQGSAKSTVILRSGLHVDLRPACPILNRSCAKTAAKSRPHAKGACPG